MKTRFALALSVALLSGMLVNVVMGQETTGGIEGTVKDSQGGLVPNVTITVTTAKSSVSGTTTTGVGTAFTRTVTTDNEGFFRLLQVPPGTYDVVTAPAAGFGPA